MTPDKHNTTQINKTSHIINALTLPRTILQMLVDETPPPESAIQDAIICIDEIVEILKKSEYFD